MRMWMIDPKKMCDQHLLGEHVELHMLVGSIKKGISLNGYVRNGLIEPKSIIKRHEQLAKEMKRRGMNHRSPLKSFNLNKLLKHFLFFSDTFKRVQVAVYLLKILDDEAGFNVQSCGQR